MKKIISIALVMLLLAGLFSTSYAVELSIASSKLSSDLKSAFAAADSTDTTLAYVQLQDVDHDAVMAQFKKEYPQEYAAYMAAKFDNIASVQTAVDDELLQRAIERKREIYRRFYTTANSSVLDTCFSEEDQVFVSAYAPIAIVETTQSRALQMARNSDVISLTLCAQSEENTVMALSEEISTVTDAVLTDQEILDNIELSNQISRADAVRDTYNLVGAGIKVGLLEHGVPDLSKTYLQNAEISVISEKTTVSYDATVVAAILVASESDGTEYGIVPEAELYCYAINGLYDYCAGVEALISSGVNIICASNGFVGDYGMYTPDAEWIDHVAILHDIHFVTSAGNRDTYINYPGTAYNALTVGGFDANQSDVVAQFSLRPEQFCFAENNSTNHPRPEKPNIVANAVFEGLAGERCRTDYAAAQVAGVIAQLCCNNAVLKYRQSTVASILAASAAEKVDAVGSGAKGDVFASYITGSNQISDKEGAGILDALWARGILGNGKHWNYIFDSTAFPYSGTTTIDTTYHAVTRVAIFWLKKNTDISHTTGAVGTNPDLTNLDLYIYDPNGNLVGSSTTIYSNFEIVQFVPQISGTYRIEIRGTTDGSEYVGLAVW